MANNRLTYDYGEEYKGLLVTKFILFDGKTDSPIPREFDGVWDTGADSAAINSKFAQNTSLTFEVRTKPSESGENKDYTYAYVSFEIKDDSGNKVKFGPMWAFLKEMKPAALIGMGIIRQGNFLIENKDGKTTLTFEKLDKK